MRIRPGRLEILKPDELRITAHIMLSSGLPLDALLMLRHALSDVLLMKHLRQWVKYA
jgi:hypothetical protein